MNVYRNSFRFSPIILSLLLHALLLFLFLSAIIVHLSHSSSRQLGRKTAAPVTMRWGSPDQPTELETVGQMQELPSEIIEPESIQFPVEPETIVPTETTSVVPIVPDYASGALPIPLEYMQPEQPVTLPEIQEPAMAPAVPTDVAREVPQQKRKRRRRKKTVGTGRMTPGQLMNAFNQAVQKDLEMPYGNAAGNEYGNSADGLTENQRYAVARARELGDYRFKGRIDDVLERTFSIYAKEMQFDEDIDTPVKIILEISADGKITQVAFEKATDSQQVNEEIKRVLLQTENIPVPKRHQNEPYRYVIDGSARIAKGVGKIRYVPKRNSAY